MFLDRMRLIRLLLFFHLLFGLGKFDLYQFLRTWVPVPAAISEFTDLSFKVISADDLLSDLLSLLLILIDLLKRLLLLQLPFRLGFQLL